MVRPGPREKHSPKTGEGALSSPAGPGSRGSVALLTRDQPLAMPQLTEDRPRSTVSGLGRAHAGNTGS